MLTGPWLHGPPPVAAPLTVIDNPGIPAGTLMALTLIVAATGNGHG
jgi:hypothetical protein